MRRGGLRVGLLGPAMLVLAGCATSFQGAGLERGAAAYRAIPAGTDGAVGDDYRIGALDRIDIGIYQEPDLSTKGVEVDAAGKVALPLVGEVTAAGRTASELAGLIARLYGARYLEHPQVSVTVVQSVSQKVVVQGEVNQPGVYDLHGSATLLEAISMAKGETKTAAIREVAVFRTVDGRRMGALFDIRAIRRGEAADPQLLGSDMVIVGQSGARSAWRDMLSTAPILSVFRPF